MAKINNKNRWSIFGLAGILLVASTGITVRHFYAKNLSQIETKQKLIIAERDAAIAEIAKAKAEVEKAHMEQELLSAERQLVNDRHREIKALMESTTQAIVVVTDDHKIAKWSRGAEQMLGWSYDDVIGKDADFLMPAAMFERHRAGFGKAMASAAAQAIDGLPDFNPGDDETASTVVIQCVAKHKDGSDVLALITVRMFMAGGRPHAFAAFDRADAVKYIDARPGVN